MNINSILSGIKEWVSNKLSSYLPKSGGTVTGSISFGTGGSISPLSGTSGIQIAGDNINLVDSGGSVSVSTLRSYTTGKIDGIGGGTINRCAQCTTPAATAAKAANILNGTLNSNTVTTGTRVTVFFNYANTANNPTLNINSIGAKNIYHRGSRITTGTNKSLLSGICDFLYYSSAWHLVATYPDALPLTGGTIDGNVIISGSNTLKIGNTILKTQGSHFCVGDNNVDTIEFGMNDYRTYIMSDDMGCSFSNSYDMYSFDNAVQANGFIDVSDARLKDVKGTKELTAEQIAALPAIVFKWKDGKDDKTHLGTIAQNVQKIMPELVTENKKTGYLGMQYGEAAMVSVINLARIVVEQKEKIDILEQRIENLEILLNKQL